MKDKEFNNILDECLERILAGESLESCLKLYPQQAAELKPLLETVLAVREASTVRPSPEFRAKARYQFRSALAEKAAPQRRPFFGWLPQWATALAIVLIVLLAGGGTIVAASNSMPDSILYPVKLATENVQLVLTTSEMGKARLCADFADRRVAEIVYMADRGDAHQVELVTERLDDRLNSLAVVASELGGEKSQPFLSTFGGEEAAPLPSPAPPAALGPGEGGKRGQADNEAELRTEIADSAANNTAVLQGMLGSVPESVRQALLEAIAVSEAGYEKVLEALP
jgi:hypothetical protein